MSITFGKTQVEFQQSSPHPEATATLNLHYKTVVITPVPQAMILG